MSGGGSSWPCAHKLNLKPMNVTCMRSNFAANKFWLSGKASPNLTFASAGPEKSIIIPHDRNAPSSLAMCVVAYKAEIVSLRPQLSAMMYSSAASRSRKASDICPWRRRSADNTTLYMATSVWIPSSANTTVVMCIALWQRARSLAIPSADSAVVAAPELASELLGARARKLCSAASPSWSRASRNRQARGWGGNAGVVGKMVYHMLWSMSPVQPRRNKIACPGDIQARVDCRDKRKPFPRKNLHNGATKVCEARLLIGGFFPASALGAPTKPDKRSSVACMPHFKKRTISPISKGRTKQNNDNKKKKRHKS